LGVIARALNQFEQAIEYYEQSIRIKRGLKDFDTLSQSYLRLAQTYQETDDLKNTLRYLNNALEYSPYSSQAQEETDTIHRLIEEQQRGS
jgi:tetratricopeptide (TPR) repeat protein